MKNERKPLAVSSVLERILKKKEINSNRVLDFLTSWEKVVGLELNKVSKPESLKKGILTVKVIDATWLQELSFQEAPIIEKLCGMGYGGTVNKIKFIVGSPLDFK